MPRIKELYINYAMKDFSHWVDDRRREEHDTQSDVGKLFNLTGARIGQKIHQCDWSYQEFLVLCKHYKASEMDMERFTRFG